MPISPGCGRASRASTQCWRGNFEESILRRFTLMCLGLASILGLVARASVPLVQISPTVYQTEHCLFIIDASVTWSSPATAYNDLYAYPFPKLNEAYDILVGQFPDTYFSVCYIANTGDSHVPDYIDRTAKASGINESMAVGAPNTFATTDFCRYNLPGGAVLKSALAVFDHELGHAWGARAFYNTAPYPSLSNGHWLSNSTVDCQMGSGYSDDGYLTLKKLYGDPISGFRWQKVDNLQSNDYETFSEQTLYLMGLSKTWPTTYVLNNVVYNSNMTASYSTVDTFDHTTLVAAYGARNPDYTTEQKRLKVGFVYIARDLAEVNTVYSNIEQSVDQFCNAEVFDTHNYRFQTPFLCDTRFRASVDGRLADLDGNVSPALVVTDTYVTSADGTAVVNFLATDSDGPVPAVSVTPASTSCTVVGSTVQIAGLPDGVHFFTLKANDAGGKKTFGHFVIEVQRPVTGTAIITQPIGQTVIAGSFANFNVAAGGSPASFAYQWHRKAAGTSTWNLLTDGATYSGSATETLTIATSTSLNKDEFLCMVSNSTGTATSNAAQLAVNETAPVLSTQPIDRSVSAGTSVSFTVTADGPPFTFGYSNCQWQRLAAGGGSWTDLSNGGGYTGSTTASLNVVSNLTMSGDQFRCVVTNTAGAVTSNVVTLTVGTTPTITVQPVSPVTISAGQGASFTVVASGTMPLSYQWSRYGVPVSGATSTTITFANAQTADAGAYTVSVSNAFGSAGSNVGSLSVTPTAPAVTAQPQSTSAIVGQGATFVVTASGTNPFSYQWKKNGVNIGGATATVLTLMNVQNSDAGSYTVVITNNVSSTTSTAATLTVNAKTLATVILGGLSAIYDGSAHAATATTTPSSLAVDITYNGSATMPTGAGTYAVVGTVNDATYQGSAAGSFVISKAPATVTLGNLSATYDGSAHAATTTTVPSSLTVDLTYNGSAAVPNNAGTYAVVGMISDVNYQGSCSGSLDIAKIAPVISWPTAANITAGTALSGLQLNATANVGGSFVYTPASGTVPGAGTLLLSATFTPADTINYSNASAQQSLVVATPPAIIAQPVDQTVNPGQNASFLIVVSGAPPPACQWQIQIAGSGVWSDLANGSVYFGVNTATLLIDNVNLAMNGDQFRCLVTNIAGVVTSNTGLLTATMGIIIPGDVIVTIAVE